jgi:predicted mannosyl-3-phosphoglycerate phosphatase (HAD superfamily)
MEPQQMHHDVHACASGTLVIFTRVEGLLRQRAQGRCEVSRDAVNAVLAARVPLVLVSDGDAAEVQSVQSELGFVQPFICDGGAELHIPVTYFDDRAVDDGADAAAGGPWERFSFETRGPAAAMRLLGALFIARGHNKILTVGLGCGCSDSTMLAAVDIPIVVRDQRHDQSTLLEHVPGAYLTTATGAAGWLEAVIGPSLA